MLAVGVVAAVGPAPGAPPMRMVTPVVPVADERVISGPLLDRTAAWLTVGDAAARVRVRFARMPGLLYRVSTASDAGVAPVVSRRGGRVTVRLTATGRDGLDEVRIVLNRQVRWDIRLPAGAGEQQLNLRDGRVQRVEVGSAGLAEVWLPEPEGTVPIVFTGGVGTAVVSVGSGTPVRVRLSEGAGSVETPWTTNNGTAAGTVLHDPVFRRARDRYAIRAEGGLGALVVRQSTDDVPGTVAPGRDPWTVPPGKPAGPGPRPGVIAPTGEPRPPAPAGDARTTGKRDARTAGKKDARTAGTRNPRTPGTRDSRPGGTRDTRPTVPRRDPRPAATTNPPPPAAPIATGKADPPRRTSAPGAAVPPRAADRTASEDAAR
ncbi:hypothetical protein AB0G04_20250 [Actinoplanes sp. NPDC023801]|uniref:hypothetical protein n=1 Tax=Actinoplanes sp. NPDC023801 TaxID=3154595 RepID=UPI0034067F3B